MTDLEPIVRLNRDLRKAAATLSDREARYLVDAYYLVQEYRKAADNQVRSMTTDNEPTLLVGWLGDQVRSLEGQIKVALDKYSAHHPGGEWARGIIGVGPVIAAGLLAHIDIHKAHTVGHIWSFAGLNPGVTWEKGKKRPWNADLKVLCWKLGESFVKVSGNDDSFYGRMYVERKAQEVARNEAGEFADQAKAKLERFKIGKTTEAYKAYAAGKLPPAHIHARAKRWVVKMFLSHLFKVWYEMEREGEAPVPYAIAHLGHAHLLEVPEK